MKHILLILTLSLTLSAFSQEVGYLWLKPQTMEYDKQKHAMGGMFLGGVSYLYFEQNNSEIDAYLKSAAFVGGIGIVKELNDALNGRTFSMDDMSANMVGWFVGATTAHFMRKWAKNRTARHNQKLKEQIAKIDSFYE